MTTFRAVWPIVDEAIPYAELCREAMAEVPRLAAQAHARTRGVGRFIIVPSDLVAGSGRVTETCLVYTAPAVPLARPAFSTIGGREPTYDTPDHEACSRCGRVRKVYRSVGNPRGDKCRDCMEVEAA
jgi:hypothetical protein